MQRISILSVFALIVCCLARQTFFELKNDDEYPQQLTVTNVRYELVGNRYLELSCTLTVYEEINDGTSVSLDFFHTCI